MWVVYGQSKGLSMKIATSRFKIMSLSSTALALFLTIGLSQAQAADSVTAPAPALTMADATPAAPSGMPLPAATASSSGGLINHARNLGPLEDKVTDSIKTVVKQMGANDSINLEDMNSARQAVAKLEVLIDIEKHLAELDKIRNPKEGGEKSIASAIPASALAPPPMFASMSRGSVTSGNASNFAQPMPSMGGGGSSSVSRISGADGHYSAVVGGKTGRVGDSLGDGTSVIAISAKEVSTKAKDGAVLHMKVHGVDEVFGHTL